MTHEEYKTRKAGLEYQLEMLKIDYLEEHSLALGTPVTFLGNSGCDSKSIGKLHHIHRREIGWNENIHHTILLSKKDGTAAKKGAFIYFCEKKHLQVQP